MPSKNAPQDTQAARFSIGRAGMDKIHAVEGIKRSTASQRMFAEFDKQGLDPEQRRRALLAAHSKKA